MRLFADVLVRALGTLAGVALIGACAFGLSSCGLKQEAPAGATPGGADITDNINAETDSPDGGQGAVTGGEAEKGAAPAGPNKGTH